MKRAYQIALLLIALSAPAAAAPQQPAADAPVGPPPAQHDAPPAPGAFGPGKPPPKLVRQPIPRNPWGKPDFDGVWAHDMRVRTDKLFYALPRFGGLPDLSMMQPWVQARYKRNYEDMQAGRQLLITAMRCLPAGVPNMMMEAHALQLILKPDELVVLAESDHQVRIIPIGDDLTHPANVTPSWNGHAIARWDGDVLVVDTVGLTDKSELDPMGTPHTTQLHVVERIAYDEFGRLKIQTTLDDPGALVRPWTYDYHYSKGAAEAQVENVGEYACAENNRDGVVTREQAK